MNGRYRGNFRRSYSGRVVPVKFSNQTSLLQRYLPVASARFLAAQLHELAYQSAAVHGDPQSAQCGRRRLQIDDYFRKSSTRCVLVCFDKIWTKSIAAAELANVGDVVMI